MGRTSPQGLTLQDFHHQPYVNPLDVFPTRSRLATRSQNYRSPIRGQAKSRSSSRFPKESQNFACCGEEEDVAASLSSNALDCCVTFDHANDDLVDFDQVSTGCCDEPHHHSPSPMDCEDCVDDCDDCVDEHVKAFERPCHYVDECEDCDEEPVTACPDGPACQDTCDECDFSCFDCVDWKAFEQDKSLGLSFSVPLLDSNGFAEPMLPSPDSLMPDLQSPAMPSADFDLLAPPLEVPMHHQCFQDSAPYWSNIAQDQHCNGQLPLPPFTLSFGCHPAAAHQQNFSRSFETQQPIEYGILHSISAPSPAPAPDPLSTTEDLLSAVSAPSTSRACQWLMPCGTVCGASFASGTDLKKHLKSIHLVKGVTKCHWQGCSSADFASEAALTGHISKKHLASMLLLPATPSTTLFTSSHKHKHHSHTTSTSEGPFKCTFPSCPKSFTYKHIRDEHVATHQNTNRMYCPICKIYLNGEGSNFKRHMATHEPKHQHTLCKFHALGCKRRFPRLDNLRRHEACCKFGKKAKKDGAGHHHHHHVHA